MLRYLHRQAPSAAAARPAAVRRSSHASRRVARPSYAAIKTQTSAGSDHLDVAIVGGGPGGLAAANAILAVRPDLRVGVFERSNLRPRGATVTLQPNGVRSLAAISPQLEQAVIGIDWPVGMFRYFDTDGKLLAAHLADDSIAGFVREKGKGLVLKVTWHELQATLAEALPPGVLHLDVAFDRFEEMEANGTTGGIRLRFKSGTPVTAGLLIGCDGGQSAVRAQLLGDGPPMYGDTAVWRAISPRPDWWPDEEGAYCFFRTMPPSLVSFGLRDGRVIWQAFGAWPAERLDEIGGARAAYIQNAESRREEGEARRRRALEVFGGWCKEAVSLIKTADSLSITEHGQFYRTPDSCKVWGKGPITLLGDSAHLATPVLGQGTNQAFEDAVALGRAIGEHGPTPAALRAYEAFRQPQMEPVQAASVGLFLEARAGGPPPQEHIHNDRLGVWLHELPPLKRATGVAA